MISALGWSKILKYSTQVSHPIIFTIACLLPEKNFILRLSNALFLFPITDNGMLHSRGAKLE